MADIRRSVTIQYGPDQLAGIPLGSSLGQLASNIPQISIGAVTLFSEPCDDDLWSTRGWYDGDFVFDPTESHDGSAGSIKAEWLQGNSGVEGGGGMRRLFSPTETLYLRYYRKASSSYVGSGDTFHPHEWQFLVEQDPDFIGPACTHLTFSLEGSWQNGEIPRMATTDALNVDNNQIGVDLVGVTELRGVSGCNGLSGDLPDVIPNCFPLCGPNQNYASREYTAAQVAIQPNDKTLWHKWEFYIQMNSVQAGVGQTDGIIQCWIDDALVIDKQNMILRTGQWPNMRFDQAFLKPFMSPTGNSPANQTLWYDDILVATAPPGGTVPPPDPPVPPPVDPPTPPPGPTADWPNEPAGATILRDEAFDLGNPTYRDTWSHPGNPTASEITILDASAPITGQLDPGDPDYQKVGRMTEDQGDPSGFSAAKMVDIVSGKIPTNQATFYMGCWTRFISPHFWHGGGLQKWFEHWQTSPGMCSIVHLQGAAPGEDHNYSPGFVDQCVSNPEGVQSDGNFDLLVGVWYRIEYLWTRATKTQQLWTTAQGEASRLRVTHVHPGDPGPGPRTSQIFHLFLRGGANETAPYDMHNDIDWIRWSYTVS